MVGSMAELQSPSRPGRPTTGTAGSRDARVRVRWRMSAEARALLLVTAVLVTFGLAVLYSASTFSAIRLSLPGSYFFVQQLSGVVAGTVGFALAAKIDAEHWKRVAWPIMILSLLLMLITVLPFTKGIVPMKGGSRRFFSGGSIQPSEFAKFAVLVWTPMLLVKKGEAVRRLGKGILPFLLVIGSLSYMALKEPDLSVAMTFCLLMAVLLFVGGARIAHFVFLGLLAALLTMQQVQQKEYVAERVRVFLNRAPADSATAKQSSAGVQQEQSLIAIGSGGVVGKGFGRGNQQRGWLPLAYNDFIASVVGEEFGFLGIAGLTLGFALYGWLGFRIARNARSPFTALLAVGLTFTTVLTAFVHIGVAIDLLPNTGLTLPFVSLGRSNLILTLGMTGILVNIGSERERVFGEHATDPSYARVS